MNPLDSNFTYDVDAFIYHPDRSMAGVFYLDNDINPVFNYLRPYPGLNLPPPYFFDIPFPFSICSSSQGLLLCYDLCNNTYHVFNPFINTPASYRRIPTPPREHQFTTPAVLDVNVTYSSAGPLFDIICAVEEAPGLYTFDTYSSNEDKWTADTEVLTIKPRSIVANTGISTGKGSVIWLTSKPHELVVYKIPSGWRMFKAPTGLPENATLQLGRTGNDDEEGDSEDEDDDEVTKTKMMMMMKMKMTKTKMMEMKMMEMKMMKTKMIEMKMKMTEPMKITEMKMAKTKKMELEMVKIPMMELMITFF